MIVNPYSLNLRQLSICLLGIALLMVAAMSKGAMAIPFKEVVLAFFSASDNPANNMVVMDIRLPRVMLAIAIGGILAICGAVMQGVFRNPLADPGVIGVSAGAALGAALAIVLVTPWLTWLFDSALLAQLLIPVFAFAGGLATTLIIYRLGSGHSGASVVMMLLAGIAISALTGAIIGLMNYLADDQMLRDLSLWQMGSLNGGSDYHLLLAWATFVGLICLFQRRAKALNALLLGEAEARHLGINVGKLKRELIWLCAFGVGVAVACTGLIGFVGLVVPHIVRLIKGPNHYQLLPFSALFGAALLLLADMISRTIAVPNEIPIGLITAVMGAPFFLLLLIKQRKMLVGG